LGTSIFLADELESIKTRLVEKEKKLKNYQERYMGGLPGQLQTNLSILDRLQNQLDQLHNNLREAENRKIIIQTQLTDQSRTDQVSTTSSTPQFQEIRDLPSLRHELASLEARYTSKHPDIRRLKETISRLEREPIETGTIPGTSVGTSAYSAVGQTLKIQLQNLKLDIKNLKGEIKKTQSQIGYYQKKVEETPKREQELLSLNRNYDNLKEIHSSLLNRKLEAEIAVSMEKKQKGEQFRVIDPAKIPIHPVKPDMKRIIMMVLALGLGLGGGFAYLMEMMDTSYKTPDEVEQELQFPVLVSMPIRYTKKELRKRALIGFFKGATVAVCFVLSATAIVLYAKGVDTTVNYVKTLLDKI
jgi:polysaccharide chain length determinant protein (PEP-CTERM system associated)